MIRVERGEGVVPAPKPNKTWTLPDGKGEIHFDVETRGPWFLISKLRGLAMDDEFIYGERSLIDPRESGYQMEGRVSIGGKKRRAFTSSVLFKREDGSLCNVAILYVCKGKEE